MFNKSAKLVFASKKKDNLNLGIDDQAIPVVDSGRSFGVVIDLDRIANLFVHLSCSTYCDVFMVRRL